jgi:cobalt-precorrin 5A hydrolase
MKHSTAIIAISSQGNQLATELCRLMPQAQRYTLSRWKLEGFRPIEGRLQLFTRQLFGQYDALIFIMATGIVVRSIAPWVKDKTTDPAVVVLDDAGTNVISLLSGHLGGANQLARDIAAFLQAHPVITTATDVNELPAVDLLARQAGLTIASMQDAKTVTACLVNRQKVELQDDDHWLGQLELPEVKAPLAARIIVSNRRNLQADVPFVQLIPPNLVLGVGCKKGSDPGLLWQFIREQLNLFQIDERSIASVCSISLKANEPAIIEAAQRLKCTLHFFEAQELQQVDHLFEGSDFVKATTGVASVSSTAAFLRGNRNGRFLVTKARKAGMTLSLFEQKPLV